MKCIRCGSEIWDTMSTIHINDWGQAKEVTVPDSAPKPKRCRKCGAVRTLASFETWLEKVYAEQVGLLTHLDFFYVRTNHGLSHAEIGKILGVSAEAAEKMETGAARISHEHSLILDACDECPDFRKFLNEKRGFEL